MHVASETGASDAPAVSLSNIAGWRLTALLVFTQLPGVLGYTIALPLLANMSQDLAHDSQSAYLVKMISGIIGPAMAVGSLLAGILADKFDRRGLTLGFGAAYLLAAVAPAFLTNLDLIVGMRFIMGFAAGALMAMGLTMAGDYLPGDKRAKTIGLLSASNMIVSLASMPVAGYAGLAGWRTAFLLYLAATPLLLLAMPSALPAPKRTAAQNEAAAKAPWHHGLPWGLLALSLGVGVVLTVPGIYVSFHLDTIGLGKTSTVAMLMMLNSGIAAVFSAIFGKAMERMGQPLLFGSAFALMGIGLAMLAYAPGMAIAIPGLLLMGMGMGWLAPGMPALAVERAGEGQRGRVVGAVQGIASVAPILGVTLAEPLMPRVGTLGVMHACGILSVLLILPFVLRRR
ncbi:MAG: MFS transporter [Novosphingobium sp.]